MAQNESLDLALGVMTRSYRQGVQIGMHMHSEAQLLFCSSGVMQVTTPKGRWLVPPQRAVWLPPRSEHAVDVLADIEMRALLLSPQQVAAHPEAARLETEFVVDVGTLLREAILASFDTRNLTSPRRVALLTELALYELVEANDASTFMPLPVDARALKVANMVLADPSGNRDLVDMASQAGVSVRTVARLFRAETSLSFKEWRQRARIMAAVELLGAGTLPIKLIALRLGFSSTASFAFAFRQVMGMTPGAMSGKNSSGD